MALPLPVRWGREVSDFDGKKVVFRVCKGPMQSLLVRGTQHFYYPLTAKTASISLSNLRGSNLGINAFCGTFKKLHKQDSSQSGGYRRHGKCRMTIGSYRKQVYPFINIDYKCVAAMAAVAIATKLTSLPKLRQILMIGAMAASNLEYKWGSAIMTANATNLISEPKLRVILCLGILALTINFRAGMMQECSTHMFTVHATLQLLLFIGHFIFTPKTSMVYTLGASILGLALGSMAEQTATPHLPQPLPDQETEASVAPCYDIFLKVAMLLWSFLPLYFP